MKTALQFSGGKDSLALVWFMQALWPYIDIVFMDTGDMYASTKARVADIAHRVPNFIRVQSDAKAYRREHGDPTAETWLSCCTANVYAPMHQYLTQNGYRQVIRGTKAVDPHLHMVFPGDVLDGMLFTFPLWHWSDLDIEIYLGQRLPAEYVAGAVGMPDCSTCTALEMCGGSTKKIWDMVAEHDKTPLDLH